MADLGSGSKSLHPGRHPFSRSYGVILPSSLTIVLPIALVCSTHPPVSVCGTGSSRLPRGFSRKYGLTHFTQSLRPPPQPSRKAHFTTFQPTYLLCIGYAFRPRLSSRLTLGGLALPRKPWVYGGGVFHAPLVTHASILTSGRSTEGRPSASPQTESSPTTRLGLVRRFGTMLSPVYCRRMSTRPVSCYALFK